MGIVGKVAGYYGNFYLRGEDLISIPVMDSSKTFTVELGNSDKEETASATTLTIQAALLYVFH